LSPCWATSNPDIVNTLIVARSEKERTHLSLGNGYKETDHSFTMSAIGGPTTTM
jgi:hypothetical protein